MQLVVWLVLVCMVAVAAAVEVTPTGLQGRWVPHNILGSIHIDPASTTTQSELILTSYFNTPQNRWSRAKATFNPHTNVINVTALQIFKNALNGSGTEDTWFPACFTALLTPSSAYPVLRWDGSCDSVEATKTFPVASMAAKVSWHLFDSGILCREDHPMMASRRAAQKEQSSAAGSHSDSEKTEPRGYADKRQKTPSSGTTYMGASPKDQAPLTAEERETAGSIRKVHAVFTQHFDLGYTDFAYCVLDYYFWYILPGAALSASEMPTYKYTTHPWILYSLINCETLRPAMKPLKGIPFTCPSQEVKTIVETAIRSKQLVWHALPYDGWNEMLGSAMFDFSFNYAEWLTEHYFPGEKGPTAIQQVDIPGLYQAQVSHILNRGVRGVYVGQNPQPIWSGALDTMPNLFMWEPLPTSKTNATTTTTKGKRSAASAGPLLMMVHKVGYGGISFRDAIIDKRTGTALVAMITIENKPSETPVNVKSYLERMREIFPNATEIVPSTYDSFIDDVFAPGWPRKDLPSFNVDVGDSWIRSSPGDPVKVKKFMQGRAALESFCKREGPSACSRHNTTLMNAVHFWMTGDEHNAGLALQVNDWESGSLSVQEKRGMQDSARYFMPELSPSGPSLHDQMRVKAARGATSASATANVFRCTAGDGNTLTITFSPEDGSIAQLRREHAGTSIDVLDGSNTSALFRVLYAVHNTTSATWGDPLQKGVLLKATVQNPQIAADVSSCAFTVTGFINQSFHDETIGGFLRKARNVRGIPPRYPKNSTFSVTTTLQFQLDASSLALDVSGAIAIESLELSDTNGVYNGYINGWDTGNSLFVQFDPELLATGQAKGSPPTWDVTVLDTEYSPFNFHQNGTCNMHIADSVSSTTTHGRVSVSSQHAPLLLFGWDNGQWKSQTDPATTKCRPDTSSGAWYNLWNSWNANWVVEFPWRRSDGFNAPLEWGFDVAVKPTS